MKAVPKVNTDGLYVEDELVGDAFSGVVPLYAESELTISGYLIGVPVPEGLFQPKFNVTAWEEDQAEARATLPELWTEGLSKEKIEALTRSQVEEPNELEMLKQRLAESEVENKRLAEESNANQLALMELHTLLLSIVSEP
ncbi:hypothetical protein [Paenibacillus silvae]|uniref:hypothetical protein n=1 Tax=Paenibacillus silvae TaxID=1325358 RepID=UPI0020065D82|nr:hypothetical protein [Paenibacillus silvae]MCK6077908.1 hypothetical protein [Paenibacillus silvae]MCK6152107.1 hypothetical protein [Paenibacillus silvae]MCK6270792.1 hypothetical protein [Paenibacillus silvae]